MGLFSYARLLSGAALRRNVSKNAFYSASPMQALMLASTPKTITILTMQSLLSEYSLSETEIKKILEKVLDSILPKRPQQVLLN